MTIKLYRVSAGNGESPWYRRMFLGLHTAIEAFEEQVKSEPGQYAELCEIQIPSEGIEIDQAMRDLYNDDHVQGADEAAIALHNGSETKWYTYDVEYDHYLMVEIFVADDPGSNEQGIFRQSQVAERWPKLRDFVLHPNFISLSWTVDMERISIDFDTADDAPRYHSIEVTREHYNRVTTGEEIPF